MAEKYRPSNGTEGVMFICAWCEKCERDKNEDCDILARTFAFDVDDPEYPSEWQFGEDDEPKCTAFVPLGDPLPKPRCERTADMFATHQQPSADTDRAGGEG